MKVLLAGATGAIGRSLVAALRARGHAVIGTTRDEAKTAALRDAGATAVCCNALDRAAVERVVREEAPEAVIVELTSLPRRNEASRTGLADAYAANDRARGEGTANFLAAAKAAGTVKRFVAQSVAFFYAPEGGPVKSETDPLWTDAPEPFGRSVRVVESMETSVLESGISGAVLRYGFFYGPGTWYHRDGDIGIRVRKRAFPLVGKAGGVSSFVHVIDAAEATARALESTATGVFNIVDDEPAASAIWLPVFAAAIGAKPPRTVPPWLPRLALGKAFVDWQSSLRGASNAKAKRDLALTLAFPSWRTGFRA